MAQLLHWRARAIPRDAKWSGMIWKNAFPDDTSVAVTCAFHVRFAFSVLGETSFWVVRLGSRALARKTPAFQRKSTVRKQLFP